MKNKLITVPMIIVYSTDALEGIHIKESIKKQLSDPRKIHQETGMPYGSPIEEPIENAMARLRKENTKNVFVLHQSEYPAHSSGIISLYANANQKTREQVVVVAEDKKIMKELEKIAAAGNITLPLTMRGPNSFDAIYAKTIASYNRLNGL